MNRDAPNAMRDARDRVDAMMMTALGPVAALLEEAAVQEIMMNADGQVWVERFGEGVCATGLHLTPAQAENFLRLVASTRGLSCHAESPRLSAVLSTSGVRLQGFVPPLVTAPAFVIRKPPERLITLDEYVATGVITELAREVMVRAVHERKNLLIAGGTGSGKTTLAKALLDVMAASRQRIVTLEDTPELHCRAANTLALYTRDGVCDMHRLVVDTMRVRPDRIVIGEVRDGAALELLKAWGTGHPGGLGTVHANSARQALTRIEQLVQEVVVTVPRALIADAIDVVIHIERFGTGWRVPSMLAVEGLDGDDYGLVPLI